MSHNPDEEANLIEHDPVWKMLEHSRSRQAGPRFVDDVVRAARLDAERSEPWWHRWFAPLPVAAITGLAAAVAIGFFALRPAEEISPVVGLGALPTEESKEARFAHLQEVLETEMLFAAVEYLDDFSDDELMALMGF